MNFRRTAATPPVTTGTGWVLRATWNKEDGDVVKDSNSCLLTHELQSMSAGLKVLKAGIRDVYVSDFQENFYFSVGARALGDGTFEVVVSFYCPTPWTGTTPLRSPAPWTRRRWRR